MQPPHLARIEHLGQSDFVKADCAAWHHVALLAPEFLLRLGLSSQTRVRLTKIAQIWRRFFDQIIRKYQRNSRLDRQELNAELLKDTPSVL